MNSRSKGTSHLTIAALCAVMATVLLAPSQASATALWYSFKGGTGGNTDGSLPYGGLVMDSGNNLYGVTSSGGTHNQGTAFEVTSTGTYCKIFDFGATGDGINPFGDLILDSSGNLYGTLTGGGAHFKGRVFSLAPPATACTTQGQTNLWTEATIWDFGSITNDGSTPYGRLLLDSGNIYGTTSVGGTGAYGTVFKLSRSGGIWGEAILHNFAGGALDGQAPYSGLVMDSSSNLYGTTYWGGATGAGYGTVYTITTSGTGFNVIYPFSGGGGDGTHPYYGTLVIDSSNNLYGTTFTGGAHGNGTVYQLSNPGTTPWSEAKYSFKVAGDGIEPAGGFFVDGSGNFWMTTAAGGASGNSGSITEFTFSGGTWTEAGGGPQYTFTGGSTDCSNPYGTLIMGSGSHIWGLAKGSGANGLGCIFKFN